MSTPRFHRPLGRAAWVLLLLCFACSGMSALIYEVAWVRILERVFGTSTLAVATVIASFMGGLALGSYLMGRFSLRLAAYHPLRLYALMEGAIGLIALLLPQSLTLLTPVSRALWQTFPDNAAALGAGRLLLSLGLLAIPTALMGATLPVISAFVTQGAEEEGSTGRIGLLYAVNTGGAVAGCLGAGLVLFPLLGLQWTQILAVGLSLTAALGALGLARRIPWALATVPPSGEGAFPGQVQDPTPRGDLSLLVLLYAGSGLAAMLYEVAWSRVLVQILGSSTYAYTLMLGTFLLGLAAGAGIGTRLFRGGADPLQEVFLCQVLAALSTYFSLFLVEELPFFYTRLHALFRPGISWSLVILFLVSFVLMILPTLGLGAMFPATMHGLSPRGERGAALVGWAYSMNTLGAIIGSLAAGFLLLPSLGAQSTLLAGVLLNGLMASLALLRIHTGRVARYRVPLSLLLLAFVLNGAIRTPPWEPHTLVSSIFRYVGQYVGLSYERFMTHLRQARGEILFFKEGLGCTVAVFRTPTSMTLLVNGKPDASTPSGLPQPPWALQPQAQGDLPTQVLLGQVPLLLAPSREKVLIVGLGSGVTAGSVLRHEVGELDCVELERAVVDGSQWFDAFSGRPLFDRRLRLIVNDARNHLLMTDRLYDIVISEPSNPWIPGAAALFTREFFTLVRQRLLPGGVLCQWVQLYELQVEDLLTILRALRGVFPHLHLFRTEADALILASPDPLPVDPAAIHARMGPSVREDLARIGIHGLEDLLAHYWIGGGDLAAALPDGPINTDDNMEIEFRAPLRLLVRDPRDEAAVRGFFAEKGTGLMGHVRPPLPPGVFWVGLGESCLRRGYVQEGLLYARHALDVERSGRAVALYGRALEAAKRPEANAFWQEALLDHPGSPEVRRAIAASLLRKGDGPNARAAALELLALAPQDPEGLYLLGRSCVLEGRWEEARGAFAALAPRASGYPDLPALYGRTLFALGDYAGGLCFLREALEKNPRDMETLHRFAIALTRLGRDDEALPAWQGLGILRAREAAIRHARAREALVAGDGARADRLLQEAYGLDPFNRDGLFDFVGSLDRQGRPREAIALLERYLLEDRDNPWAVGLLGDLYGEAGDLEKALDLATRYHTLTGMAWSQEPRKGAVPVR